MLYLITMLLLAMAWSVSAGHGGQRGGGYKKNNWSGNWNGYRHREDNGYRHRDERGRGGGDAYERGLERGLRLACAGVVAPEDNSDEDSDRSRRSSRGRRSPGHRRRHAGSRSRGRSPHEPSHQESQLQQLRHENEMLKLR